jgi:aspartyl-tRNA(Asn)/glutamyl-tRNA(Gln) amidotransferase subunit C
MSLITNQELIKLARISQITVHEDKLSHVGKEVEGVLNYASSLYDIANNAHSVAQLHKNVNIMRNDEIQSFDPEIILACAPEREESFFVVPKIIKQ